MKLENQTKLIKYSKVIYIIYLGEQVFQGPALVLIKEQATHQKNLLEKAGILVAIAFMQKIGL